MGVDPTSPPPFFNYNGISEMNDENLYSTVNRSEIIHVWLKLVQTLRSEAASLPHCDNRTKFHGSP